MGGGWGGRDVWMERTSLVLGGGIQFSFLSERNNKLRYGYLR